MKLKEYIEKSIDIKKQILCDDIFIENIQNVSNVIISALKDNKKILIMGNGGSASDSNHIAAEFVSKFMKERSALPAISLSSNQAAITAIANDYDFKYIFSRQIEALGNKDDILIGISTSGVSKNIIEGFKKAKEKNMITVFLTGENAKFQTDYILKVPSNITPIIQEAHVMLFHIICNLIEENLFKI